VRACLNVCVSICVCACVCVWPDPLYSPPLESTEPDSLSDFYTPAPPLPNIPHRGGINKLPAVILVVLTLCPPVLLVCLCTYSPVSLDEQALCLCLHTHTLCVCNCTLV